MMAMWCWAEGGLSRLGNSLGATVQHPPILVLGYSEASMLLCRTEAASIKAIISIHNQREFPVEAPSITQKLILQFDDVDAPASVDSMSLLRFHIQQKNAAERGMKLVPPTMDHAREVIEFAKLIKDIDGTLLCQCQGGISRSSAAALLCLATWMGRNCEAYCVEHLLGVRKSAVPLRSMVSYGDTLLGFDGRLAKAAEQIGVLQGNKQ